MAKKPLPEIEQESFDICIIDADSIVYEICFVNKSEALAKRAFDKKIDEIMTQTRSDQGMIYIKGKDNFRHIVDTEYKANRKDNIEPEVKERINKLYEYVKELAMESNGGEADDMCIITANMAVNEGKTYVLSHIDKDLNCMQGWHHNFKTGTMYQVTREQGYRWLMQQLLTGDSTDNIKGIYGIGPVKADNIIGQSPVRTILGHVIDAWKNKVGNGWEEGFIKCANNIYLRETFEDVRPLTLEELLERLQWKQTPDTGLLLQTGLTTPTDSYISSTDQPEDLILGENNSSV
jgi:5'-3' exonuclease